MTQKTVFISGATSGIGLVTAQKLQALGWKIYAGGLVGDDFSVLGDRIQPLPFDITDANGVAEAVTHLNDEITHLDALINNAGIQVSGAIEALSMDTFQRQFDVNVMGHLQVTKALLPLLRKADAARIVNVSSLMGQVAMPMLGAYSMSKHALEALSDVLRMELKPFGIHVAVVEPAAIATPMSDRAYTDLVALRDNSSQQIQDDYQAHFEGMIATLQSQTKNATSPDLIADVIIHALSARNPKARYAIGIDVKALSTIRKMLPTWLGDWILMRALGIK
ncbi:MAG: SDR family oxidoreductase [Phototrophicaceae bacterium]